MSSIFGFFELIIHKELTRRSFFTRKSETVHEDAFRAQLRNATYLLQESKPQSALKVLQALPREGISKVSSIELDLSLGESLMKLNAFVEAHSHFDYALATLEGSKVEEKIAKELKRKLLTMKGTAFLQAGQYDQCLRLCCR